MNTDKMFEELGFKKAECTDYIEYRKITDNKNINIVFIHSDQTVGAYEWNRWQKESDGSIYYLNAKELEAIIKKINELGW